jgi:hypothetical protein
MGARDLASFCVLRDERMRIMFGYLRMLIGVVAALAICEGRGQQAPETTTAAAQTGQPASVNSGGAANPDGLNYYRQNPQLAQRYFPGGVPGRPANEGEAEPRFSIKFNGGSPELLVEILREAMKTSAKNAKAPNVVIANSMRDAEIPSFALQNVTVNDVFQTLNSVADASKSGQWVLSGSTEPIWVLNPAFAANIDPLTGLPAGMGRPPEPRSVQVFPVSRYLGDLKIDDLTTAIQTAWNLLPSAAESGSVLPTLKFHKDTELLLAVGTDEQLRLAKEVLNSLREGMAEKMEMERITAENAKKKEDAKKF